MRKLPARQARNLATEFVLRGTRANQATSSGTRIGIRSRTAPTDQDMESLGHKRRHMITRSECEFQTRGAGCASPDRSTSHAAAALPHLTRRHHGRWPSAATPPDISHTRRLDTLDASPSVTRPKTALIIEGGGVRGAWAAGALAALREFQHDPFDLVVAVSSGACSAAYFVADNRGMQSYRPGNGPWLRRCREPTPNAAGTTWLANRATGE